MYLPSIICHTMIANISAKLRSSLAAMLALTIALIMIGNNPIKAQDLLTGKSEEQFLTENAKNDGVETTESGLQFQTIKAGEGPSPAATDIALVGYKGMFIDGTVFDEIAQAPLPIVQVVPGFAEALQKMQKGGEYKIWIPSNLGYGPDDQINPQTGEVAIPGGSVIIFEVNLIDFKSQAEIDELRRQTAAEQSALQTPPQKSFEEVEKILGFETVKKGTGKSPSKNDTVLVSYRGMLTDGTIFDQNAYTTFPVNQLIPGFSVALQKMQVGGQYIIKIPSEIGYGPDDRTNPRTGEVTIPGGSTLVFEVNLLHFITQTEIAEFNNKTSNQ